MRKRLFIAICLPVLLLGFFSFNSAQSFEGSLVELPAFDHPVQLFKQRESFDKLKEFKKLRKYASSTSAKFLDTKVGSSYFTQELAPIALDALYEVFVPKQSGQIGVDPAVSIADGIVNQLLAKGQKRLTGWTEKIFPELPLFGNVAVNLLDSQRLRFEDGTPRHQTFLKKPVTPKYQMGPYSFSGGAEFQLDSTEVSRTPLAAFKYSGSDEEYSVRLHGKQVRFNVKSKDFKVDLQFKRRTIRFKVDVTF